jgi:hypothetical protein
MLYRNRYYVDTHKNLPAVYDTVLGLRAYGGTVESMEKLMVSLAGDDEWFANNPQPERTPSGGGGCEVGMTMKEYNDTMDEWYEEKSRIQCEEAHDDYREEYEKEPYDCPRWA